jgi:hypothetical protein
MTQHELKSGLERLTARVEPSADALTRVLRRHERRRRARRTAAAGVGSLIAIALVAGSLAVLGGRADRRVATSPASPAVSHCPHVGSKLVLSVAGSTRWSANCWVAPADTPLSIRFEPYFAVPDYVAIFPTSACTVDKNDVPACETEQAVFMGEVVIGPDIATYDVPPLASGDYTFVSPIHPGTMNGRLTVVDQT